MPTDQTLVTKHIFSEEKILNVVYCKVVRMFKVVWGWLKG